MFVDFNTLSLSKYVIAITHFGGGASSPDEAQRNLGKVSA